MPKLWRYNLHYFDYLRDSGRSRAWLASLVSDWIENNPVGTEDAWEPYTVSLRIVNWIKWFLSVESAELPREEWLKSLYLQTSWLEKNIEYHLLANHYLKNGKALCFAGCYLSGTDARRWLKKGLKILREEAHEQVLADGGHYERSPMYHCIVVEDYLDVLNLLLNNPGLGDSETNGEFRARTVDALDFLNDIVGPDGRMPLFNDSALGIASAPEDLFGYAHQVIRYERPVWSSKLEVRARPATGYYTIRDGGDMLTIDCGQIGPDYQPGHAHCDTLSYELWLDGRPVVVDTGVHDYEASETRAYARSTRAHNTVVLDNEEQSEFWGVFRVARRARPLKAHLAQVNDDQAMFQGAHDGYQRLRPQATHQRTVEYSKTEGWWIRDELMGRGVHRFESFVHFAPDLRAEIAPDDRLAVVRDHSGNDVARIVLPDNVQAEVINGRYFPEFGLIQENQVIRLYADVELPFRTAYAITKVAHQA